jgi:hypothetical protein
MSNRSLSRKRRRKGTLEGERVIQEMEKGTIRNRRRGE